MGKLIRFLFWTAAIIGVVVGLAHLLALRWWQIPVDDPRLSASITPTLRAGDWVILWRATPPHFGALVACPDPQDETTTVIGRLVGESGDTLNIDGGRLSLNKHRVETETACSPTTFKVNHPSSGSEVEQHCSVEILGGVYHMRGEVDGVAYPISTVRTVDEGKVFLVSDNRAFPYDSRSYGTLDRSSCKETVVFRIFGKDGFDDADSRFTFIH
jgi:signal peptidase I